MRACSTPDWARCTLRCPTPPARPAPSSSGRTAPWPAWRETGTYRLRRTATRWARYRIRRRPRGSTLLASRVLRNESGYSLVEVMASIMILTVAIIPMVGMFDMGLNAATSGGQYDTARAFANKKLEQAKSLPYDSTSTSVTDVKDNFPLAAPTTTTYNSSGATGPVNGPSDADISG